MGALNFSPESAHHTTLDPQTLKLHGDHGETPETTNA